jgi:hypothetical protein
MHPFEHQKHACCCVASVTSEHTSVSGDFTKFNQYAWKSSNTDGPIAATAAAAPALLLLLLLLLLLHCSDITAGWGMSFDPDDLTKFRGYECPAHTYGEQPVYGKLDCYIKSWLDTKSPCAAFPSGITKFRGRESPAKTYGELPYPNSTWFEMTVTAPRTPRCTS